MFRLMGFDVRIQPGFVVFMLLIVFLYADEFGLWLAGSIAVLTLVHELGHAVAARNAGAEAEISLGFLAGYASYRPTREISRAQHAFISFAGPGIHIAIGTAAVVALGANPLDIASVDDQASTLAIWWAGPIIGALNLIPVLPLDGGNIVLQGLDRLAPSNARRWMLWFSIAATLTGAVWMFLVQRAGFAIFIAFLLITQLQMLQSTKPTPTARSPWDLAGDALDAGREAKARRILVGALSHPQPISVPTRLAMSPERGDELLGLLPQPFPTGDPGNEHVLASLLLARGRHDEAAHYAAGTFARQQNSLSAVLVARAAAAAGDQATAIAWLRQSFETNTAPGELAASIDRAPEFASIRHHPDVVALRSAIPA
ncbi:MAG: hypothetical protein AAFP84_09575 [Actinomycetota bacterium]